MRQGRSKEYLDGARRHGAFRLPLEKFFRSRLGRPWSEVHSEMSKEFDRRTYAGFQFWRMVKWEVAQNVWIGAATGTVYEDSGYSSMAVDGFYVHPWTGILCYQKRVIGPKKEEEEKTRIIIDDRRALEKMEGIWYYTEYSPVDSYSPYYTLRPSKDYNVNKKRQLSSKELAVNKLVNTPMDWETQVCEVCHLVDGSNAIKKCIWCRICSAWICASCKKDWMRRARAAEMKLLQKKANEALDEQMGIVPTANNP